MGNAVRVARKCRKCSEVFFTSDENLICLGCYRKFYNKKIELEKGRVFLANMIDLNKMIQDRNEDEKIDKLRKYVLKLNSDIMEFESLVKYSK